MDDILGGLGIIANPMAALGAATLGAVSGIGETMLTNSANRSLAAGAQDFDRQQAEDNRAFQQYLSDTSYQRGVKDMRAAGINPMLAIMKGGASTPSGAQASSTAFPSQPFNGLSSALNTATTVSALGKTMAETDNIGANTKKTAQDELTSKSTANLNATTALATAARNAREAGMYGSAKSLAEDQAKMAKKNANLLEEYGDMEKKVDIGSKITNSATGVINAVSPITRFLKNVPAPQAPTIPTYPANIKLP